MPLEFSYPTTEELREIDPLLLDNMTDSDPVFTLFPRVNVDTDRLRWSQRDSYGGLMKVRGLNGEPTRVRPVGRGEYSMEPGVYGEYIDVDELEMTRRASSTNPAQAIPIADLVRERQEQLMARQTNRIRWILWELLVNGRFVVTNAGGAIVHADSYDQQVYTASDWSTVATATPIADFRAVARLSRGVSSATLGAGATAYMNQITFDRLIGNTNAADLGGQKTTNENKIATLDDANGVQLKYGLPRIVIYDEGWLDEDGTTWTPFIPDDKVVVIGRRANNAALGEWRNTRNANNEGAASGPYYKVIDHGEMRVPRKIEVHRGFNGGAALFYPGAIAVMSV